MMKFFVRVVCVAACAGAGLAQDVVPVGKGSYASRPPAGLMMDAKRGVSAVDEVEQRKLYLVKDDGAPVPSNEWFQNLLFQQYGTGLWAMPHRVDATKEGIEIFAVKSFSGDGVRAVAEFPLVITGRDFKPQDSRAKAWADWMVSFRMFESESRFFDVTLGEGMPAVWCEFAGVQPVIACGALAGKGSRAKKPPAFFDVTGKLADLPVTGDAMGITHEGRAWGVFAPDGTKFAQSAEGIAVTFAGKSAFLVVCPLPSEHDMGKFHKYAFAVPRDTKLSWNYDRKAGTIATTWTVETEALKGTERAVIQGWLPHHWRENTTPLEFIGAGYPTIRGQLKCAAGNSFTLTYPFNGVLPNLPAPKGAGYDAARTKALLADHFAKPKADLGRDTYWGGKKLEQFAQAAFIARESGDASFDVIAGRLRAEFENWFTYTPGEKDHYFAYYPRRKGLVGFSASYGSEHFTDTHFHQGYFVHAAGLLAQMQPDFAAAYGDMARLLAKNYANWDRADRRFPYFRTFDVWRGHSFADGNGFPGGNNQESTGEAVNSWAGMILLGEALGDAELTAAGVMGYSFETRANVEYWFDPHGDVFRPEYAHDACGMIWCDSIVWGTWFTASPSWIYGIQWLPIGPQGAFYDRVPGLVTKAHDGWQREQAAFEEREAEKKPGSAKKPSDIKSLGGELASYHLGFLMHGDAARVVSEFDRLWAEPGDKVAHNEWMANLYWQANALRELGRVDWSIHADSPTATAYRNGNVRTLVAWNPTAKPQTVAFFDGAKSIGSVDVPAHSIASTVLR